MTRALVIGYGSIGQRHASWLRELGCDTAVVSNRVIDFAPCFKYLDEAIRVHQPEYIVIANVTAEHEKTLKQLTELGFKGKILVEKPLFKDSSNFTLPPKLRCYVAYNLRFHPMLQRLHQLFSAKKVIQVHINVGKYLPTWRPGEAIRYSGSAEQGGGVLRDLSHELDYACWIFGPWEKVTAIKGHHSSLNITSEDAASILMETERAAMISVQLNYLDRIGERSISVQTDDLTVHANLISGIMRINEKSEAFTVDRSQTFLDQHRAVLKGDESVLCSFAEGLEIVRLIEAVENSDLAVSWSKA